MTLSSLSIPSKARTIASSSRVTRDCTVLQALFIHSRTVLIMRRHCRISNTWGDQPSKPLTPV
jgi:hypothetical protein